MVAKKTTNSNPFAGMMSSDPAHVGDMMSAMMRAQAKMMDSILKQNIETLDFLKNRFEKDRGMMAELAQSTDPQAAMTALSEFWSKSMQEYTDEAGKMGAIVTATAEQIVEGVTEEAKAMAGGAPRKGQA